MEELLTFLQTYGWQLSLIALAGVIILGVLKYCNVFKKVENENLRHFLYLIISVGVSLIGSVIYLACVKMITAEYIFVVAGAILALDQTFYAIYSTTSLKDLVAKVLEWIASKISGKKEEVANGETEDNTEETTETTTEK